MHRPVAVAACVLVAYATWRSFRPIPYRDDFRILLLVLFEVALHVLVVEATGFWESPFVFSLITAVVVAGFARGFTFALRISLVSVVAIALPFHLTTTDAMGEAVRQTAQGSVQLVLVAVVAGYARRVMGEAEVRHSLALDRLGRLAEANSLLYALHQVAQALPASLDLEEVLDSTVAQVRSFFDLTALAVFLVDDATGDWFVSRQVGSRLPPLLHQSALPASVARATTSGRTLIDAELGTGGGGLSVSSHSGLYAPLLARGQLVGVLAMEHHAPDRFSPADADLMDGFTESAGLAIDNARWFARLRTVGADEERLRIARELHDRVGQSLAYIAFEMDRLVDTAPDTELRVGMGGLRGDVRTVLGEIRETLYDLRTDVTESTDLVATMTPFLERVERRAGIEATLDADQAGRLPLLQEREMWRIAQEAVSNAERHAEATLLAVRWACDEFEATLEVADDGRGFDTKGAGRMDSYGILGMRERAAGIGATLSIDSSLDEGTVVRCSLVR